VLSLGCEEDLYHPPPLRTKLDADINFFNDLLLQWGQYSIWGSLSF